MNHTTNDVEDITLSGSGTIAAGRYNRVKIAGSGKISGDVEANQLKINGSASLKGRARINEISVNGSVKFNEDVEAMKCVINGSASSDAVLDIANLTVNGSIQGSQLRTTKLKNQGSISMETVEAEEFISKGTFSISKELNAHHVQGILYGSSFAREIGGERIEIESVTSKQGVWGALLSLFKSTPLLKADSIEGTVIYLENTNAKVVRGERIRIGPNCKIECVEYLDTLEVSPESKVNEIVEG
ncbi:hypothetical protein [Paenibacillus senegalensis]|uniref:hypothetical protein n=1 Tax=Paenibacillus senegalensis TaxID=1465766 RepID=UPI0002894AE7|nr:hypothetical protein [Paenibacillus senegalensis]